MSASARPSDDNSWLTAIVPGTAFQLRSLRFGLSIVGSRLNLDIHSDPLSRWSGHRCSKREMPVNELVDF